MYTPNLSTSTILWSCPNSPHLPAAWVTTQVWSQSRAGVAHLLPGTPRLPHSINRRWSKARWGAVLGLGNFGQRRIAMNDISSLPFTDDEDSLLHYSKRHTDRSFKGMDERRSKSPIKRARERIHYCRYTFTLFVLVAKPPCSTILVRSLIHLLSCSESAFWRRKGLESTSACPT